MAFHRIQINVLKNNIQKPYTAKRKKKKRERQRQTRQTFLLMKLTKKILQKKIKRECENDELKEITNKKI